MSFLVSMQMLRNHAELNRYAKNHQQSCQIDSLNFTFHRKTVDKVTFDTTRAIELPRGFSLRSILVFNKDSLSVWKLCIWNERIIVSTNDML